MNYLKYKIKNHVSLKRGFLYLNCLRNDDISVFNNTKFIVIVSNLVPSNVEKAVIYRHISFIKILSAKYTNVAH